MDPIAHNNRISGPIRFLLFATFLLNVGQFMVIPFLTLYLNNTLHYSPWQTGSVLSANVICSRAFPLFTGMLGDRIGHRFTMISGITIRAVGFLGYASLHSFLEMLFLSVLTGIGTALYDPSISAIFATQPETTRIKTFTLFNQALNLGALLGPLFGSLLILTGPIFPFVGGGGVFFCIAGLLFVLRRHYKAEYATSNVLDSFKHLWNHKTFISFTAICILFWIIYTQLTVSLPIQAFRLSHHAADVSAIFIVNGLVGGILMFGLKKVFQHYRPIIVVAIGALCVGLGFFLVPLFPFPSIIWLLLCVGIYTLGETLFLPGSDMAIANFSNGNNTGAFFGMFTVSWAIGGTIGNYSGTVLMDKGGEILPWMIFSGIGFLAFLLLISLKNRPTVQKLPSDA